LPSITFILQLFLEKEKEVNNNKLKKEELFSLISSLSFGTGLNLIKLLGA